MIPHGRLFVVLAAAGALTACADVDAMLHNPRHCSIIGPDTCENASDPVWGKLCATCDDPYDWAMDHPWMEQTFEEGQSARPIDAATVTQMSVPTADGLGTLDAYLVPAHGDDPELAGITVVYSHGNFAGIEHYLPRVRYLHELGVSVFVWDYRGYGKSQPDTAPNGEQFVADARTALNEALNLTGGAAVVPYGYSLGAIPAVEMGLDPEICALILETPAPSMRQNGQNNTGLAIPGSFISGGYFENDVKMGAVTAPSLVMAATYDHLFPVDDVRTLSDASPSTAKVFIEFTEAHHGIGDAGIPETDYNAWADAVRGFLLNEAQGCGL